MNHFQSQPLDQQPVSYWRLCVLLLLLNSLAFTGWVDFRQASVTSNSGFVAEFNQLTLANHRDHFRSLLDIKNLASSSSGESDNEPHWLAYFNLLSLPIAVLRTDHLRYLTLLIFSDDKYHLPLNRAPPYQ